MFQLSYHQRRKNQHESVKNYIMAIVMGACNPCALGWRPKWHFQHMHPGLKKNTIHLNSLTLSALHCSKFYRFEKKAWRQKDSTREHVDNRFQKLYWSLCKTNPLPKTSNNPENEFVNSICILETKNIFPRPLWNLTFSEDPWINCYRDSILRKNTWNNVSK